MYSFYIVPLFNGIATDGTPFDFSDDHFKNLPTRKLWDETKYNGELPSGSIIAVGYTLHTWGTFQDNISPNLVFAIVLYVPPN